MVTANDQLRQARHRTASLAHPGECMSRQELAEQVNTWIWEHHNTKEVLLTANYIGANYIGKLEQDVIRWPCALYREAFRAIFGVATDSVLGFINGRRKVVKLDNVKRRQLIHEATTLGVSALTLEREPLRALLDGGEPAPVPRGSVLPISNRPASPTRCSSPGSSPMAAGWPGVL